MSDLAKDVFDFACLLNRVQAYSITGDPKYLEKPMPINEGVPCRASADLRQHEHRLELVEAKRFDPQDENLMHDVCGNKEWAEAIAPLLVTLEMIEQYGASFGVDNDRTMQRLLPQLKALRAAAIKAFEAL